MDFLRILLGLFVLLFLALPFEVIGFIAHSIARCFNKGVEKSKSFWQWIEK